MYFCFSKEVQMANNTGKHVQIFSHEGNANNQNDIEIPSHFSQNGFTKKTKNNSCCQICGRKQTLLW
jgi:hypothetical protein